MKPNKPFVFIAIKWLFLYFTSRETINEYFQALQKHFQSFKLSLQHFKNRAQNTFTLKDIRKQFEPFIRPFLPFNTLPTYKHARQKKSDRRKEGKIQNCFSFDGRIQNYLRTWGEKRRLQPYLTCSNLSSLDAFKWRLPTRTHQVAAFWFDSIKIRSDQNKLPFS